MPALPPMTPAQRAEALQKAQAASAARKAAMDEIRNGTVTLASVLSGPVPPPLQGAKVRTVLLAVPGVGKVTADTVMANLGIQANRRVKGLGPVQKAALRDWAAAA